MAGRPVAARGGGLTGLHYGLIAFVILTVIALVLFVLQLTKTGDLEAQARRFSELNKRFGDPPAWYQQEAENRKTKVFAVFEEEMRRVAKLVSGVPEALPVTIEREAGVRLTQIAAAHNQGGRKVIHENATLLSALQALSDELTAARQAEGTARESADTLTREKQTLVEQADARDKEFRGEVDGLNKRLTQAEDEKKRQLDEKDKQLAELAAAQEAAMQELQQLRTEVVRGEREKDLTIARLEKQVDALHRELSAVKPSTFDPDAILTNADGRVLRAIPGSEIVYINLGEKDKLKVGMGFEVYSQTREVQSNLRGKASLEVLTILNDTAECRITRETSGQPVVEGDIVVNIAYERNRQPKFLVVGDFDLDYNSIIDPDGLEKMQAIVREWGGQIVDELDESTDYVVVGLAPRVPTLTGPRASTVVRAMVEEREVERTRFKDLINEARSMYIPVMTQNAFLVLTGYAGGASPDVR